MSTITAILVVITGVVLVFGWMAVNKKEVPRFRRDTADRERGPRAPR